MKKEIKHTLSPCVIEFNGYTLDLTHPRVMGILNITPDSFSDGGKYFLRDHALRQAEKMIYDGATIIDVGGESTRPNATILPVEKELDRVIPIVEALANYFEVWISVDTYKADVMREAAKAGAHLINDIYALRQPNALQTAAETGLPVCLMHMQGSPETMQTAPYYQNIIDEVALFFEERIAACQSAGIDRQKLILDPGFGFGKRLDHNYQLLANLHTFSHFDLPLLAGLSRKSMIGQLLNVAPEQRMIGSVAGAVIALMKGAKIIRVHDVKETVEAMRVVEATLSV